MKVFIIACLIFIAAFLCMSVGLIFGKARLRGSCCGDSGHSHDEQDKERCIGCPTSSDECAGTPAEDRSCSGARTTGHQLG
jgi:hypothetical protein